ncbi:MAG: PAS domain S-box protein [Nitrospirota bacterium]
MTHIKLISGLLLGGVAYWLFDSAMDAFIFHEGTFRSLVFTSSPHEIGTRLIIITLLAITSYVVLLSMREKKAEADLREKEKLLSESQRIAHIGSWAWEIEARTMTWTEETYRIYGRSPETFVLSPESFLGLLHPDDRPAMQDWISACLAGNNPADLTVRALLPDGTLRFINGRGGLERDAENKPVRMVGTVQDITEQKLAEEELLRQKGLFSTIIESTTEAIFAKDTTGRYHTINIAGAGMLGYRAPDVIGRTDRDLLPAETAYEFRKTDEQVMSSGQAYKREEVGVIEGKTRVFLAHKTPWRDKSGNIVGVIGVSNDITERKLAEKALQESEAKFRTIFENSLDAIVVSRDDKHVFANPAYVKLFGYDSIEELIGMQIVNTIAPEERERVREFKQKRKQGLAVPTYDVTRGLRKDGTTFNMDVHVTNYLLGGEMYTLAILRDITEAKRAQDLLRLSEEKYRSLVELAHDGIIIVKDGIIKFANTRMAELDGSSVEELLGTPYTAHVHPSEMPRVTDMYRRRMAGEALPSTYETILLRKDGSPAPSELSAGVILYDGKPADMVIIRDITERKRAEEALKESELRFSSLMQTASDGVIMSDAAGAIMTWNIGAEIIFGYTNKEALGKPLTMLMPERYRKEHLKGLERVSTSGTSQYLGRIMDFHGLRKDGSEFPLELSVTSWVTQKQVLFLGIIRDLTEHRKLEDQLRQAQKMEAVGQLAGGVAHDFNNILSAIIGYGSLAEMKLPEDHPVRLDLEQIHQSAARATTLTQSLLTFSRRQPVKKELLDLNAVIGTFEKFLLRLLREDIEMTTRLSGDELLINADRGQIEQVVMNLVTNARDAMPNKGALTLETKPVTLDESFMHAHGYGKPGEYVMFSASDTGMGMNEETKRRIFEPFFTTKEQGKGTGLGLATVYGIVKTHDGFISVYSEPGKGTAFHIYLPRVRSSERAERPAGQTPVPLKGGVETILLAEDDASLRKMTTTVLRHMGYTVIEAENGREAVDKFIENKDVVRLVILDGIMPKMNGKEAHREITALVPGVRCIFMSGYAEDVFTKNGALLDAVEFISKPITPAAFLHKVREVLDR